MKPEGKVLEDWLDVAEDRGTRRLLGVLLAVGLLVHLLGFLIFRVDLAPVVQVDVSEPFVVFVSPSAHPEVFSVLQESTEMEDPSRLLLPVFAAQSDLLRRHSSINEPIRFHLIDPDLRLGVGVASEALPVSIGRAPVTPETLLEFPHWRIFDQVGRRSFALNPLPPEQLRFIENPVELRRMRRDGAFQAVDLARLSLFTASDRRLLEGPFEMSFRVDERGMLSPAIIRNDPGNAAFVEEVLRWLRSPQNSAALEPGLYRLRVFP